MNRKASLQSSSPRASTEEPARRQTSLLSQYHASVHPDLRYRGAYFKKNIIIDQLLSLLFHFYLIYVYPFRRLCPSTSFQSQRRLSKLCSPCFCHRRAVSPFTPPCRRQEMAQAQSWLQFACWPKYEPGQ